MGTRSGGWTEGGRGGREGGRAVGHRERNGGGSDEEREKQGKDDIMIPVTVSDD